MAARAHAGRWAGGRRRGHGDRFGDQMRAVWHHDYTVFAGTQENAITTNKVCSTRPTLIANRVEGGGGRPGTCPILETGGLIPG